MPATSNITSTTFKGTQDVPIDTLVLVSRHLALAHLAIDLGEWNILEGTMRYDALTWPTTLKNRTTACTLGNREV